MDIPSNEEPAENGKDSLPVEQGAPTIRQRKQQLQSEISRRSASLKHQYEVLSFNDHYTLRQPSACVTFQGESIYVYELNSSQLQLKVSEKSPYDGEFKNNQDSFRIEIRDVQLDRNEQVGLLRLTYTLVAMFCMATFFCFSFLVVLFTFMDLVADVGLNGLSGAILPARFLGTVFAIPVFLYGFSSLLTVWQFFIQESWNGFPFLRNVVTDLDEVIVEWITLIMMLGAPVVTLIINLFLQSEKWWENTIFVWYISVSLFFAGFTVIVVYCECETAWLVVFNNAEDSIRQSSKFSKLVYFLGHAVKRTQEVHYCGYMDRIRMRSSVIVAAGDACNSGEACSSEDFVQSTCVFKRTRTRMAKLPCFSLFFEEIDPPRRIYSIEEILGNRRFITRHNWSIEKSLCSSSWDDHVPVVNGPEALRTGHVVSSLVCMGIALITVILLVVGGLRWMALPRWTAVVLSFLILAMAFPQIMLTRRFLRTMISEVKKAKEEDSHHDHSATEDGVYQLRDTYRVSRPTRLFRRINLILHFGLFHTLPLVTLILLENYPILILFIIVSIWTCVRYWLDPVNMLNYHGDFDCVKRKKNEAILQEWRDKCRVNNILLNVTRAHGTKMYTRILLVLIFVIFALAIGVLGFETVGTAQDIFPDPARLTPIGAFEYPPQSNLKYPTCNLLDSADILNNTGTSLIDYNFLADMIYQDPKSYQGTLDEWFGPDVAKVDSEISRDYKEGLAESALDINYDLFSFGDKRKVIVVRGSKTSWEWLTDAQLWAGVALMEFFLSLLPAGDVFKPILDDILLGMGYIESKHLKDIQLNSQTTGFANYIRDEVSFNGSLSITGHSLGGGISLITGAQANISAIAISGPNNIFSRRTFDPVLDIDTINTFLFNVVPERDLVPIIDQSGFLTQKVACTAPANNFIDCHHATRTLCELMYKCGSFNRPVPCDCAVRHGYPEPTQISGDQSFSDVCGTKRTNGGSGVPYDDDAYQSE